MARGGRRAPQSGKVRPGVRWFSAAILVTCVTVTGVGLALGFRLDHPRDTAPAAMSAAEDAPRLALLPVAAADTSTVPDAPPRSSSPTLAARATLPVQSPPAEANFAPPPEAMPVSPPLPAETPPPTRAQEQLATLAAIEPLAGTSAPEPAPASRVAVARAATIPTAPRHDAAGHYWVEYAVFAHERSAEHLRQALAALHLKTSVVATHTPEGRRLWRVRSATAERSGIEADARRAEQKLGIKPLIHRTTPRRTTHPQYWVQFGAFPTIEPAVHLQRLLADNGVKASLRSTRTSTGKPLFLVRSDGFPDRKLATLVGELGGNAAKVAFLIGRSPPSRHAAAHHAKVRGAIGSSLPPPRHVPRPGG